MAVGRSRHIHIQVGALLVLPAQIQIGQNHYVFRTGESQYISLSEAQ